MENTGRIHSFQSLGAVDGPGLRYVVFLQGCPLRCQYCHNPDTWDPAGGTPYTPTQVAEQIAQYRPYLKRGGVTVSGGEPLAQPEFVAELFRLLHSMGLHTALDTSGAGNLQKAQEVLLHTDLVLCDIKFLSEEAYRQRCHGSYQHTLDFLNLVQEMEIPLWVRHVVVPGLTDSPEHIRELAAKAGEYPNLEKLELLPFRKLCLTKYQELGIPFPLADVPEMSPQGMGPLLAIAESCGKCRSIPL